MTYTRQTWTNDDRATPLSADRLTHIEDGLAAVSGEGLADHEAAVDPHGDRDFADAEVGAHAASADPHADRVYADAAVGTHRLATDPHGDRAYADALVSAGTSGQLYTNSAITSHCAADDPHGDRGYTRDTIRVNGGVVTLTAGTATVTTALVTASSRIQLTGQDNNVTGALRVSARTAGTSFAITSLVGSDSGVVAYQIFEP